MMTNRTPAGNSTYPKDGVTCSEDGFMVNKTFVLKIIFSGKNPALRIAKHYKPFVKTVTSFILLYLLTSFSSHQNNFEPSERIKNFLALFDSINASTFKINYFDEDPEGEANTPFKGKKIDSSFYRLIESRLTMEDMEIGQNYFACYKFPLTDTTIGLILRTPSLYIESSVRIYILDLKSERMISNLELANAFGDGGAQIKKESLISISKGGITIKVKTKNIDCDIESKIERCHSVDSIFNIKIIKNNFIVADKFKLSDSTWVK